MIKHFPPPPTPVSSFPDRTVTAISRSVRALARRVLAGLDGAHDLPLAPDEQPNGVSNPPSPYNVTPPALQKREDIEEELDRARRSLSLVNGDSVMAVHLRTKIKAFEWVLGQRAWP